MSTCRMQRSVEMWDTCLTAKGDELSKPLQQLHLPLPRCSAEAISARVRGKFGKKTRLALFKSEDVIQDVLVLLLV